MQVDAPPLVSELPDERDVLRLSIYRLVTSILQRSRGVPISEVAARLDEISRIFEGETVQ